MNGSSTSDSTPQQSHLKQQLTALIGKHDFIVIGHRGAAGLAPENTLSSFATALHWQCPMVELDVYACRDTGAATELMVIHDDKLNRTTNGRGKVINHTVAQLRSLDAGEGQRIPLLGEVVDLIHEHNAAAHTPTALNIELKGPDTAEPTAQFISRHNDLPMLVSSFNHAELQKFQRLAPDCPVAPLYDRYRNSWPVTAGQLHASAINLSRRIATEPRISKMREAGYSVFVYTVNTVSEAQHLKAAGANGVFSDRPDLLIPKMG